MSCDCPDGRPDPRALAPKLDALPDRAIGDFGSFRNALLSAIEEQDALAAWRARDRDDLGVMLLEWWAYVCDVQAFYDRIHAQEGFVGTAVQRASLRKLVELLGYRPSPAVAAEAVLAIKAAGRKPTALSPGVGFRSAAFDEEAPQVFELDADAIVHPLLNQWALSAPRPTLAEAWIEDGEVQHVLVRPGSTRLEGGEVVIVGTERRLANRTRACRVDAVEDFEGIDTATYTKLTFSHAPELLESTKIANVRIWRATQSVGLWTLPTVGGHDAVEWEDGLRVWLTLDSVSRQIRAGQYLAISDEQEVRWYEVTAVEEVFQPVDQGGGYTANVPTTRVKVDEGLNNRSVQSDAATWTKDSASILTVHHRFVLTGAPTAEASPTLTDGDSIQLVPPVIAPSDGSVPRSVGLVDRDETGVLVDVDMDLAARTATLEPGQGWDGELQLPVSAYGNLVRVSRGQTVRGELLGVGDGSVALQAFKLKKSPLTYVLAPTADNDSGVQSTLVVYVDGVAWEERESFYGTGPDDRVYVVWVDDDEIAWVAFGDGDFGARLPTGARVTADYRFGAGAATPPSGSITKVATAVPGIASVLQPEAAYGGADREASDSLAENAPRSALLLGRAVSIADFQAAARAVPSVVTATAGWRWSGTQQRPVVLVDVIGDSGIEGSVRERLLGISEDDTPIEVRLADPDPIPISIDLRIDETFVTEEVRQAVAERLLGEDGALLPASIGIGTVVYRSQVYSWILEVPGVQAVTWLTWDGAEWTEWAKKADAGVWFDFAGGGLTVDGEEVVLG